MGKKFPHGPIYVPAKLDEAGGPVGPAWFKEEGSDERILLAFTSRELARSAYRRSVEGGGALSEMLAKTDVALTAGGERLDTSFAVIAMSPREFDSLVDELVPLTLVIDSGAPSPYIRKLARKG